MKKIFIKPALSISAVEPATILAGSISATNSATGYTLGGSNGIGSGTAESGLAKGAGRLHAQDILLDI